MLDLSFLPIPKRTGESQVFIGPTTTGDQIWQKPRGISMIHIFALGPGGNGGNGFVGAVSAAGGGGGGGAGGQSSLLVPACFITDSLRVRISAAGSGNHTYVYLAETPTSGNTCLVWAGTGNNGGNGTASAGGTAGTAGAAGSIGTTGSLAGLGIYLAQSGAAGGGGGFNAVGSTSGGSLTLAGGIRVTSGSGGGGLPASGSNRGGHVVQGVAYPYVEHLGTRADKNGYALLNAKTPMTFYAGIGGTSGDAAGSNGQNGGDGSYGCGGGGGGSALTGFTAGTGGRGGDGLVIISCW